MNSIENENVIGSFLEDLGTHGWTLKEEGIMKNNVYLYGFDCEDTLYISLGGWGQTLTHERHLSFFLAAFSAATKEPSS